MSALRRLWTAKRFRLEHGGYEAEVYRLGGVWCWDVTDALRERPPIFGTAETMAEAMTEAESAIERALGAMTREAIIMESANVDCRLVRP